jgi:hypothetical protein
MNLCQYKNIFGEPKKGLHSYRIFDIALIDFSLTLLISLMISKYYSINIIYIFLILLILSLIFHKLFCVETTLTKLFFYS